MRNYNLRNSAKKREQLIRKTLNKNMGYWPSMPIEKISDHGELYYTEGFTGKYKGFLKKQANKRVRSSKLTKVSKGSDYKRLYDLTNRWF